MRSRVRRGRFLSAMAIEPDRGRGRQCSACLLYTTDAADGRSRVDLGGRRILKKKKKDRRQWMGEDV